MRLAGLAGLLAPLPGAGIVAWPRGGRASGIGAESGAGAMQIELEMEGGLAHMPGLVRPVAIPLDQVPAAEAQEIRDLVAATGFFDLPAQVAAPAARGADRRSFIVTVTEDGRRHTVTVTEPIEDERIRRLVRLIETQARAARRRGAAGQAP